MEWNKRSAYLMVKAEPGWAEKVWKETQKWEGTIGSWIVTGEWDVLVWVDARSWDEVYGWASKLRSQKGVAATSSHWVHQGWKNGLWWWEKPAGAWVLWRNKNITQWPKQTKKWHWVISSASVPGDWDCFSWIAGNNWNEVWNHVWEFNKAGWETQTLVPVRSWWNKTWKKNWWG